jgi:hypothetical protein
VSDKHFSLFVLPHRRRRRLQCSCAPVTNSCYPCAVEAKYGKLGQPIARAPAAAPARKGGGGGGGGSSKADSRRLGDWHDEFVELVSRAAPSREQQQARDPRVIAAKASDATNGLETSSFTVCTRIRPPLGDELSGGA